MNLLLFLSAILTALTGVVGGVRPVEIAVQHQALAATAQRAAVPATALVAGHTHLLGAFGAGVAFALGGSVRIAAIAAPRLYLDRPRA